MLLEIFFTLLFFQSLDFIIGKSQLNKITAKKEEAEIILQENYNENHQLHYLLMSLATSFASFDWLMSLYPHWFSTIFGIYYFAGCMLFFVCINIINL